MNNRVKGLSLLDYLWVNYGPYKVSDNFEENSIPSSNLLKNISEKISNEAVNSIKIVNNYLVGYNVSGESLFSLDISEIINGGKTVVSFGKRYTTNEAGYPSGTPVYFLGFSDGSELLVPIDEYEGLDTSSVVITISLHLISGDVRINNEQSVVPISKTKQGLQADLKISDDVESIKLTKELEGLKAKIILDNEGLSLKFRYLTIDEYHALEHKDPTTVYFLKNKKYFYFGEYLIGEGASNLDDYYTKEEIDLNVATKDYVEESLSDVGFSWKSI